MLSLHQAEDMAISPLVKAAIARSFPDRSSPLRPSQIRQQTLGTQVGSPPHCDVIFSYSSFKQHLPSIKREIHEQSHRHLILDKTHRNDEGRTDDVDVVVLQDAMKASE